MKCSIFYITLLTCLTMFGCDSDFLNDKPNKSHIVPTSLSDFEAILDDDLNMNGSGTTGRGPVPGLGEAGSDDYFILDNTYTNNLIPQTQNYYRWAKDIYDNYQPFEWQYPYACVFNANIVLDGLRKIERKDQNAIFYDRVMGGALFFRAFAFYQLAQVYCPPYQKNKATSDLGLPLRMSSDIGEKLTRSSVEDTYIQIISDLKSSLPLLPELPAIKTRPSKQAAYALLARISQTMQEYENASKYADSCLQINGTLLDYNTLNSNIAYPFSGGAHNHKEVIFACNMILKPTNMPFRPAFALVDSSLYNSYDEGDLRKTVFFSKNGNGFSFKGSYEGNSYLFAGLATDEIYLIRAESLIRMGKISEGFADLNKVLKNRWTASLPFTPLNAVTREVALNLLLTERRKELLFRGLRWSDLRRLNIEGHNITLRRVILGQEYSLPPNDKRYTYPIPTEVIAYHPEWVQNER